MFRQPVSIELLTHLPVSMCRPHQHKAEAGYTTLTLYVSSSSSPEKNQSADQKLLEFMASKNSALKNYLVQAQKCTPVIPTQETETERSLQTSMDY